MRVYPEAGCAAPDLLLPKPGTDLARWAVVACDQYTSEPEYWERLDRYVGDAPSTLRLIYPEVHLGEPNADDRIAAIRQAMHRYLEGGVFHPTEGLVYLERGVAHGRVREGLMVCIDLERYDYHKGSDSLVRATEGTIEERIPPRIRIREGAPLELPHIMVLIDDPEDTVFGRIRPRRSDLDPVYDFDLYDGAGHLSGWRIQDLDLEQAIMGALAALAEPEAFRSRYQLDDPNLPVLLYAMGDGNHSLATAKAIWERTRQRATDPAEVMNDPSRYALVELVNVHDDALDFEPIHRVLFGLRSPDALLAAMRERFGNDLSEREVPTMEALTRAVDEPSGQVHRFGYVDPDGYRVCEVRSPAANLPVGTLQDFLDSFLDRGGAREIDYVHGDDVLNRLGRKPLQAGFYLPAMRKSDLFRSVVLDGALPRKTFSMGEAWEKRFYLECRRIR